MFSTAEIRSHLAGVLLWGSVSLLLAGCGGGDGNNGSSSGSGNSPPADTGGTGAPAPAASLPTGVYADLESAPVGAYVTVYGVGTGAVSSWPSILQTADKTVLQVPASRVALTVNGQPVPVRIHTGRVITVTPQTAAAAVQALQPGDTLYLRAGTYAGRYDAEGWNESNFVLFKTGTAAQPIALLAYPGESVTISNAEQRPNFHLGDGSPTRQASYLTISGFNMVAPGYNVFGGGYTSDSSRPESGATHVRLVRNTFTITDASANTMTGMVSLQGDGWKVLGNTFVNPASRSIINNNHAIYIQNGADDVEVAYNTLTALRMGHVIQVHQDGAPMLYTNLQIHHNLLQATNPDDMRGLTVSNVDDNSTVTIANNTLRNLGQDFSGITVYRGKVTITNNLMYGIKAAAILLNGQAGGTRSVSASGNRLETVAAYPAVVADTATLSDITLSGNTYCGGASVPAQDRSGTVCR